MNGRRSSVDLCRQIALEVWRVERSAEPYFVHGFSSERVVRERLQKTAIQLLAVGLPAALDRELRAIDFSKNDPLSILERSEALLANFVPGSWATPDDLIQSTGAALHLLMRLLIIQCVAGRVGRWAVRPAEIPDARVARGLYKDPRSSLWERARATGLLTAASAFANAGNYISALWTVRTCLLEQRASFESQLSIERAMRLEKRLRAMIEGRADIPLSGSEAQLLLGERKSPATPPPLHSSKAFAAAKTERVKVRPQPKLKPAIVARPVEALEALAAAEHSQLHIVGAKPLEVTTARYDVATWAALHEKPRLVSETYDIDAPGPRTAPMTAPITIDIALEDAFELEAALLPALEDLPTDTSIPLPPVITLPSVREITERIRARGP